jgi:hypothetical protein
MGRLLIALLLAGCVNDIDSFVLLGHYYDCDATWRCNGEDRAVGAHACRWSEGDAYTEFHEYLEEYKTTCEGSKIIEVSCDASFISDLCVGVD